MSEQPQQSEAARRAAARKAKILARGNAGLNKLAQSARGEEAQKLYPDNSQFPTLAIFRLLTPTRSQSFLKCLHSQHGATTQATSVGSPAFFVHPAVFTTPDVS